MSEQNHPHALEPSESRLFPCTGAEAPCARVPSDRWDAHAALVGVGPRRVRFGDGPQPIFFPTSDRLRGISGKNVHTQ